jgi:hypothetical protein
MKTSNKLLSLFISILFVVVLVQVVSLKSYSKSVNIPTDMPAYSVHEVEALKDFSGVETSGAWNVRLHAGKQYQIKISASPSQQNLIKVFKDNDTLYLTMTSDSWHQDSSPTADITLPSLSRLATRGAAEVHIEHFNVDQLAIDLTGATKIRGNDNRVAQLTLHSSGASDVDLTNDNVITSAKVDLSGASDTHLTMGGGDLTGSVSGAASVNYKGKVKNVQIDTSGFANVKRES